MMTLWYPLLRCAPFRLVFCVCKIVRQSIVSLVPSYGLLVLYRFYTLEGSGQSLSPMPLDLPICRNAQYPLVKGIVS
ncbi:MAG: hypothetical protein LBI05_07270 [Planctomycetaceae bacterium]|nr:hypothetical protein [Planctomycetaceae bacterium]